jgi:hypothetical protein
MRVQGLAPLALLLSGCVTMATRGPPATGKFDPSQRDQVYARALMALQARRLIVAASDRAAGLLSTQKAEYRVDDDHCESGWSCLLRYAAQIVLDESGAASVVIEAEEWWPSARPWKAVRSAGGVAVADWLQAELLAEILGLPPPPAPVPPPLPRSSSSYR